MNNVLINNKLSHTPVIYPMNMIERCKRCSDTLLIEFLKIKEFTDSNLKVFIDYPKKYILSKIEGADESAMENDEFYDLVFMKDGVIKKIVNTKTNLPVDKISEEHKKGRIDCTVDDDGVEVYIASRLACTAFTACDVCKWVTDGEGLNIPSGLVPLKDMDVSYNQLVRENLVSHYFYNPFCSSGISARDCLYTEYGESLGMIYGYANNSGNDGYYSEIYVMEDTFNKGLEEINDFSNLNAAQIFEKFGSKLEYLDEKDLVKEIEDLLNYQIRYVFPNGVFDEVSERLEQEIKSKSIFSIVEFEKMKTFQDYLVALQEICINSELYDKRIKTTAFLRKFAFGLSLQPQVFKNINEELYQESSVKEKLDLLDAKKYHSFLWNNKILSTLHPSAFLRSYALMTGNSYYYYLHKNLMENDPDYSDEYRTLNRYIIKNCDNNNYEKLKNVFLDTACVYYNNCLLKDK